MIAVHPVQQRMRSALKTAFVLRSLSLSFRIKPPRGALSSLPTVMSGNDYLRLEDSILMRQCRIDVRRDSGPGGQKRNKVESAVRISHEATGVVANAADERSQLRNREIAMKRLRFKMAHTVRRTEEWLIPLDDDTQQAPDETLPDELRSFLPWKKPPSGCDRIGRKSLLRPIAEQALLDVLDAAKASLAIAALFLGTSTSQLSKLLTADDDLFVATNSIRHIHGQAPIRRKKQQQSSQQKKKKKIFFVFFLKWNQINKKNLYLVCSFYVRNRRNLLNYH